VTLVTDDMARAVAFYSALGFALCQGGGAAPFSSFRLGAGFLNLVARGADVEGAVAGSAAAVRGWGRAIVHVSDVDAFHARVLALGLRPEAPPRDAGWGERYFHLRDPDGHELSFARPIASPDG
jgi:catechol 2,3-dioxygenase-like lactoylglutathione lyase family enzyme